MKKIIAAVLTVVILFTAVLLFSSLLKSSSQDAKYSAYFDAPERYDIVFLGSSHVIMGALPLELWKDYGFSSYNLGNYSEPLQASYWLLRFILEKDRPGLVVLDPYPIFADADFSYPNSEMMHGLFEQLPFSRLKLEAIEDMFTEELKEEYYFPLSYYHSRWKDIDKTDFDRANESFYYGQGSDESAFYGTPTSVIIRPYESEGPVDSKEVERTDTLGKQYLRKIIELCRDTDTRLLLALTPLLAYDDEMRWVNSAVEIAREYGVPVLNGIGAGIVDPKTDMFDYGHLNSSGARKWTAALGKYISENFDLPVYTQGETADFWAKEYYEKYIPYKSGRISSQNMLYNYLMLCADKNFSVCLYIPSGSAVFSDGESIDLIRNLSPVELTRLSSSSRDGGSYLCFIDNPGETVTELSGDGLSERISTSFGEVDFTENILYINGEQTADWFDHSPNGINKIQFCIAVIDNYSGSVIDTSWFFRTENGVYASIG